MKRRYLTVILLLLIVATIIDIFVPDPVPFVDEIALIFLSLVSIYKYIEVKK